MSDYKLLFNSSILGRRHKSMPIDEKGRKSTKLDSSHKKKKKKHAPCRSGDGEKGLRIDP